ncbi:hypothetical protein POX_a00860 [Penicillium oxalicum]|uniref:hypothetical protein n=1 Tax=Penicillium oxalicum TaxID=69781 RepID=UPI0020B7373F|nr:hypothetical protein POX_a00860 [Penicillium oxalicum]KAI2794268.1 hypothetical protein POX_a00860 [Penicillium oxalicum]
MTDRNAKVKRKRPATRVKMIDAQHGLTQVSKLAASHSLLLTPRIFSTITVATGWGRILIGPRDRPGGVGQSHHWTVVSSPRENVLTGCFSVSVHVGYRPDN